MTTFLLVRRERGADCEKLRFPLVNRSSFETKRNAVKSTISETKSGASANFATLAEILGIDLTQL
jgi:hypothetical protein